MGCRKCGKNVKVSTVGGLRKVTPKGHRNAKPRLFASRSPRPEAQEGLVDSSSSESVSEGVVGVVEGDSEDLTDSSE